MNNLVNDTKKQHDERMRNIKKANNHQKKLFKLFLRWLNDYPTISNSEYARVCVEKKWLDYREEDMFKSYLIGALDCHCGRIKLTKSGYILLSIR